MRKKKELLERRDALKAELSARLASFESAGSITADEEAAYAAKEQELAEINAELDRIERMEARAKANVGQQTATPPVGTFRSTGEFMQSVIRAGIPGNSPDPRLQQFAPTGMGELIGADGGYLVGTDVSKEIWQKTYETGAILSRIRRWPIGAGSNGTRIPYVKETTRATGSRFGGLQVYRRAEAGTVTAKKPALGELKIELETGMALAYLTDEIMADAPQLETLVRELVPQEIAFTIEDEIINGNGVGKCLGILNSGALVSVTKETGQLAATVQYENLVKMWSRLWGKSQQNAVWLINQDVYPQLFTMGLTLGTGGVPVWMPPSGAAASPYSTLFGRPVIPVEQCATLGTVGDVILADFSQYILIEKGGIDVASSMHVQFLYAEQVLRFMWRNNGMPIWQSALTPYKGTNTVSPFVVVATRA